MKPFAEFLISESNPIRYVLTDIDDTLTLNGRLPSVAFVAMEKLQKAGIAVIPITGRPAGWCDHIARMWPVDGVVGENGAFYFRYDGGSRKMIRRYWKPEKERLADRKRLNAIQQQVLKLVPGARVASDQAYREADLAIDFCEDQSTYIPVGQFHRLENIGTTPLELIEVQSGSYLGEDDIVRFEDVYGRL